MPVLNAMNVQVILERFINFNKTILKPGGCHLVSSIQTQATRSVY